MPNNIVELLREQSIENLFKANGFNTCFGTWKAEINRLTPAKTPRQIVNLGDNLSNIFALTKSAGRSQSDVSGGGAAWEALVCWYLNLCLIGRRTVVIKHHKSLIPQPISDAITVNYNNFVSNTESDLIAITFPDKTDYSKEIDKIDILDEDGIKVPLSKKKAYNLTGVLNALCHRDFTDIEIHIIQCKTNWNDNAQIPMLWDMIYSANNFKTSITVGRNGYSIHNTNRFTYSFVTVPTSRMDGIKPTSTCVKRVTHISGGNYWGKPSLTNISNSIKEMLQRNLDSGHKSNHLTTLSSQLLLLESEYKYFNL